jgi:hypothetical protein
MIPQMRTRYHLFRFVRPIAFALCIAAPASAQPGTPIAKSALVKTLKSGLSTPKELVGFIDSRGVDFVLTPDVEAELKAAGATPAVIEAVRAHSKAGAAANTPVTTLPPPKKTGPPPMAPQAALAPGVYRKDGLQWIRILDEGVKWKKGGSSAKKLTFGLVKGEMVGTVPGMSSPNLLHNPITFLISVPEGAQIAQYMLIQMKTTKKGIREINVAPSGEDSKNLVPFTSRRVGKGMFEVDFSQGAGDYGFLPPGQEENGSVELAPRMFTFRVLQ